MTIDLAFPLDVGSIAGYQSSLSTASKNLDTWSTSMSDQKTKALADWSGGAADAFGVTAGGAATWTSQFSKTVKTFADAVQVFCDSANGVKGRLDGLKERALAGGLIVHGVTVSIPPAQAFANAPGAPPSDAEIKANAEYNAHVELFNTLSRERDEDFSTLYEAHLAFQLACKAVLPPGLIEAGDRSQDPLATTQDVMGKATDATKLGIYLIMGKWGRYSPRGANGRFLPLSPETLAKYSQEDFGNWVRKPGTSGSWWEDLTKRSGTALKLLKGVEGLGWALTAFSAVNDARTQWDLDSHDPTLDGWEKTLRAGAAIVADEAAPLLGGFGGAAAGAAIGIGLTSETGPGAIIGGIIGGAIGGAAGGALSDGLRDTFHGWIDGIRW